MQPQPDMTQASPTNSWREKKKNDETGSTLFFGLLFLIPLVMFPLPLYYSQLEIESRDYYNDIVGDPNANFFFWEQTGTQGSTYETCCSLAAAVSAGLWAV